MNRKVKIFLIIFLSIFLNLVMSVLVFDVLHIPLFLDTIFTVAVIFYLGLLPGLAVAFFYNFIDVLFNYLARGIFSPTNVFFSLCGVAIALVTWAFARRKEEFKISPMVTILYLLLISVLSSFVSIFIGGTIDFVRFTYLEIPDSMAPIRQFTEGFLSQRFSLFASCILGQIPISITDRLIATFAGYGVYRLCYRLLGPSEEL